MGLATSLRCQLPVASEQLLCSFAAWHLTLLLLKDVHDTTMKCSGRGQHRSQTPGSAKTETETGTRRDGEEEGGGARKSLSYLN